MAPSFFAPRLIKFLQVPDYLSRPVDWIKTVELGLRTMHRCMLSYLTGNLAWILDHNIGSALQRGCIANVLPSGYARWQERRALFPWPSQRPQSVFFWGVTESTSSGRRQDWLDKAFIVNASLLIS